MSTAVKVPPHLSTEAKKVWRKLAKELPEVGVVLEKVDSTLLETYCNVICDIRDLSKDIQERGRTVMTPNGLEQVSPSVTQLRSARADQTRLAKTLGIGAGPRKTLGITKPVEAGDGFEEFAD